MRKLNQIFLLSVVCVTVNSVYSQQTAGFGKTGKDNCLQKANGLLDEALRFMQKHYYRKTEVNWDSLIVTAKSRLSLSANCDDIYETITWCFRQLNETHSFVMPAGKAAVYNYDTTALQQKPDIRALVGEIRGERLGDSIAYLTIPWVSTTDSLVCMQIADSLQQLIATLDAQGVSKWIIDLRKNTGGNCWPMLAGVGPLLGDGLCGYFINGNERIPITYKDGHAMQGKNIRCSVSNPYQTKSLQKSIIVLTGNRTVSSGEIVALAFKGRENVRLYGEPTAGYTTANATYSLSDNSMLVLTVCTEADRTGRVCSGKIVPDTIITQADAAHADDIVKVSAMNSLSGQKF